jgi:hypothetical protein
MSSGIGVYFGWEPGETDEMVLHDLLISQSYDASAVLIEAGIYEVPNSIVASLPSTLLDLHTSSMSDMPFVVSGIDPDNSNNY